MIVAIGGMHRSGTSMLARVLNLAGLDLGSPNDMIPEDPDFNAKGHWENLSFVGVSEQVMETLGGTAIAPPLLVDGWWTIPELAPVRANAQAVIDEMASRCPEPWGWKDPRVSVTARFWREIVPDIRFVCCVRNPVDVVASLQRRDKLPADQVYALWYTYTDLLLTDSIPASPSPPAPSDSLPLARGGPGRGSDSLIAGEGLGRGSDSPSFREGPGVSSPLGKGLGVSSPLSKGLGVTPIICHYEDLIKDWRTALPPLLASLGLPPVEPGSEADAAIDDLIDDKLKHFGHTPDDLYTDGNATDDTKALYSDLLDVETGAPMPLRTLNMTARIRAHATAARAYAAHNQRIKDWGDELDAILKEGPPATRAPIPDIMRIVGRRIVGKLKK